MANLIRESSGGGLRLTVTNPVRAAGLVEENEPENPSEGDTRPYPTYRAEVRVHAFDSLLLVANRDTDRVKTEHEIELVTSAARDTGSIYRTTNATVGVKGHGYSLQLANAEDAGFRLEHEAPVQSALGVLFIHKKSEDAARLAADLVGLRNAQVERQMNH